jgi:hypothetical protein
MARATNKKAAVEGAAPNSRVANESKEVVLLGKTRLDEGWNRIFCGVKTSKSREEFAGILEVETN